MSPQITMTPAIITAMPGAGTGSPSRIAASIARHRRRAKAAVTTSHDQRDPNRLPRPMERLPRQQPRGCDAGGDECERRPKPRKIRPFIRELELRFRTPFAHVPHPPLFRDAESLVRATRRTSPPGAAHPLEA